MVRCVLKKGGYGIAMFDGVAMVVFLLSCMVAEQTRESRFPAVFRALPASLYKLLSFSGTVVGCAGIQALLIHGER